MSNSKHVINLYRLLLKEASKFGSYNFRNYALRRIRDSFRDNKNMTDPQEICTKLNEAIKSLELIKRQVIIGQLYSADKLVIEKIRKEK